MKTIKSQILLVGILMSLTSAPKAFGLDNTTPPPPASGTGELDSWDDDVWADWGNQPTTKGGAPPQPGLPAENKNAENRPGREEMPTGPGMGGGDSFGGGNRSDVIRFRLVREGINDEIQGPRKSRPKYGPQGRKSL